VRRPDDGFLASSLHHCHCLFPSCGSAQLPGPLAAIVRKRLGLEASLCQILQILSVTLFEKTPILRALQACDSDTNLVDIGNQLILANF
jgi:hypothetical protein